VPARELTSAAQARRNRKLKVWSIRAALVVAWLVSWELAATYWIDPFFYSKPSQVWFKLVDWFTVGTSQGSIWTNIAATMEEAVIGFLIGAAAGIVLGVLLGRSPLLSDICAPFIKAVNAVPRIVLASLFVIWFAVFFNAFQGAREVDRNLINNARVLGASKLQVLLTIVLPSATSWILASLHSAFGFALIGAVVGEVVGSETGLGLLIARSQGNFDTPGIYAGMIVITVLALLAEAILTALEKRLLKWRPAAAHEQGAQI
jgi:NitT/TauT family transport system permease protein